MTLTEDPETAAKAESWYDLVLEDRVPLPEYLRERKQYVANETQIPVSVYITREHHLLEKEHIWRKAWQVACREENIPQVGSYVVYDIAGDSYLVVRSRNGIKAYVNSCLHRGRVLKDADGRCSEFRCPFHGFTWRLDGKLRYYPAHGEFPDVDPESDDWKLPEAKVGTWGGFVFINPDLGCEPLEEFLGDMPEHFAAWDFENRYLEGHVAKLLRCNWKIAQEAFDEGLHLAATHPQSAPYVGDANAAVDTYGNWARQISPSGTPVEDLPVAVTEEEIVKRMLDVREGEELPIPFQQDSTARDSMAVAARERWRPVLGDRADTVSDAELVDHWNYAIFPNYHPWGGYNRIVYRFRPNGDRHDECIFEVMFLTPFNGERPPSAKVTWVGFGESAAVQAPELSTLALVMDQDAFNMESVQRGLEATRRTHVTMSTFQESMITWRHDKMMALIDAGESAKA
ncbi:aromatic ring-hydroxylating dioxygenase subunit alpha [Aeromicrobium sp.]|uniref:aromatic ring-hydroxylating oxygenase subunit alpha n=1 Tax=Aeromicrobium sp. TaxID=1871063 RepID=UPI0019C1008A|nr:aromatic ring-hydroxylating dioxygenase subunit alpha [Aeromicrobium sp.]MBC7633786.1 aromatic ring-hydroxylating dioxygenase subunit alpha [Aeromicrobium sp.]